MRILADTNVLLDYYLGRKPFFDDAYDIVNLCLNDIEGFVAPHSLSNLYYILHRVGKYSYDLCRDAVIDVCSIFRVANFSSTQALHAARNLVITDFEDALQCESAIVCAADYIVTRDISDFANSSVKAILPHDFLEMI